MQPLRARFVPYRCASGFENMAADEYLISCYQRYRVPVLRIYGWDPPSISLGRYQKAACLHVDACRSDSVNIVRRVTGGGAIFHFSEVTYSLAVGERDLGKGAVSIKDSFGILNGFIIEAYHMLGLDASYAKDSAVRGAAAGSSQPFCFAGNEEFDILIRGKKIGGNAQRRTEGVIFQHGSIPLTIDADRIMRYFRGTIDFDNFTCLEELLSRKVPPYDVIKVLPKAFSAVMKYECHEKDFSPSEKKDITFIMKNRYRADSWMKDRRGYAHEERQAGLAQ
ncbi:MAG: lipoate--protein ligase family protein [Spirochaetes bacterium]|nr:lipoate--protein ligase family protein [Spirochaetota bacterium]